MDKLAAHAAAGTGATGILLLAVGAQDISCKGQGERQGAGAFGAKEKPGMAHPVLPYGLHKSAFEQLLSDYLTEKHGTEVRPLAAKLSQRQR